MKTKPYSLLLSIAFLVSFASFGCMPALQSRDAVFQSSIITSLLAGVYDGQTDYSEVKKQGDFGLGTFNSLDGEMVGLHGEFYQVKADGTVFLVEDSMKTPFVMVKFFKKEQSLQLKKPIKYIELTHYLDTWLPTNNIFFAIKIEGVFRYIKARSVPQQHKPYLPLAEAIKNQVTFEYHDIEGAIVGFRSPEYMEGITVPGYHLHFIAKDRKSGGHLLDCIVQDVAIEIDYSHELHMVLPHGGDFYSTELVPNARRELDRVEKNDIKDK